MLTRLKLALSLCALIAAAQLAPAQSAFTLHDTWKLGGDGSWDYLTVDAPAHILYIARLDRIMVVDTQSGKLLTEITGIQHAHGVAFNPNDTTGYITDGGAGNVLVFDRKTFKVIATIPAGKNPDSILYEPTTHRVFAFNGISHNATVIEATNNKVLATIPTPGKPEFSVADGTGNIFLNIEDSSNVLRLDAHSLKFTATWSLAPGKGPSGLAIDTTHHRLYSVCDNEKAIILNSLTGKQIAALPIGEGADAVAYDAATNRAFTSNGESGTISVIGQRARHFAVLQTLPTKLGARTLAVDPSTNTVYTVSAALGLKPPASPANPKRRPAILPGTFVVLAYAR